MAKTITRKNSIDIKATISIADDKVMLEIEDYDEPVNLATLISDFDGQDVTVSVKQNIDITNVD